MTEYNAAILRIALIGVLVVLVCATPAVPACPDFLVARNYPSQGEHIVDVKVADLNEDGYADLAMGTSTTVLVRLGNGDGTFGAASGFAAGDNPWWIAPADVNGDGHVDLIAANARSSNISILIGGGNGTFAAPVNYGVGSQPSGVTAGDVDDDGDEDLTLVSFVDSVGTRSVQILLNNGQGVFGSPVNYAAGYATSLEIDDFNNDGKKDLVVSSFGSPPSNVGHFAFLRGRGDGTFEDAVLFAIGGRDSDEIAVGDFNGDGNRDVAVGFYGDSGGWTIRRGAVVLGNGDGTFGGPIGFDTGSDPTSIAVVDLDSDGVSDLAIANSWSNDVSILHGHGDGTFATPGSFVTGPNPSSIAAVDFNGDGRIDLATANNGYDADRSSVSILVGNGDGSFVAAPSQPVALNPSAVTTGDFNADGRNDLAVADYSSNTASISLGNGDGTFARAIHYSAGSGPTSVAVGDFTHDGKSDLVLTSSLTDAVSILAGKGDGTFDAPTQYAAGMEPYSLAVGDLNGDGNPDLAVANRGSNDVAVLLGAANGAFAPASRFAVGIHPESIVVVDLNADGSGDLAVANDDSGTVSILIGDGRGSFAAAVNQSVGAHPFSVAAADFNLDGVSDLAVANRPSNDIAVLLGRGDGTFDETVKYPEGASSGGFDRGVAAGDLNGDGRADLVRVHDGVSEVSVLFGRGDGTFGNPMKFDTGSTPYSTAIADLDGDGRNDLVTTNYLSQTVTILLDRSTCPMISAVTPDSGPVGGGQSVAILGAHFEGVTSVTFGGVEASISESGETDINVLAPPHTVGSVDVIVTTNSGQVILSGGYTYVANTSVPWGVRAIASTVGRVDVSWGAFPGAMSYQIDRKSGEGSYQQIGTTDANAFVDVNVSPGKAYLYRVRAVTDTAVTGNSVPDLATTFSFSDNPLPLHGTVKAIHLAELRTAVDGVRGVAGLGPASFTDAATRGTTIRAMHISELRSAIAEALAAIGIADTYTGSALTVIRRAHFQELRDRLR